MAEQPGITITRVFAAPREHVWREWTEPERFADWFGAEVEVPIESVSMDVREGGAFRMTMIYGPRQIQWKGEYREVVPPSRLVFTISDQPGDEYELVIVDLKDLGDGRTEMAFQQLGAMSTKAYEAAKSGWGKFFDRMAERLAAGA